MKLEEYIDSINNFEGLQGMVLSDGLASIGDRHEFYLPREEDYLFYAKGFYEKEITDKFYFFDRKFIKTITLHKNKGRNVGGYSVNVQKTDSIKELKLTLDIENTVELEIFFNEDSNIIFNNKNDSPKGISKAGNQIKEIYKMLTE